MEVSTGNYMQGWAHPHPDITDPTSRLIGALKRFCFRPPTPDPTWVAEIKVFTQKWCEENLVPLSEADDFTFETWINLTPYTQSRKEELIAIYNDLDASDFTKIPKNRRNIKSFTKKETYKFAYKHHRTINARDDAMKVFWGPIFKAIEKQLFARREFIKKIPVKDRPAFIMEDLYKEGATYFCSDYSSFESLFTEEIMSNIEGVLYKYMTKNTPISTQFIRAVAKVLFKANLIDAGSYQLIIEATRMSGEMNTSLGNGFANLMILLFICHKIGTKVVPKVEGDDNLSMMIGPIPTVEHFAKLGMAIKIETYTDISETSFCGQVFAKEALHVLTDPRDVLTSIGWIDGQFAAAKQSTLLSMLRAKAWSFGYQYMACPIISSAARAYLRLTRSYDHTKILKTLDSYKKEMYQQAFDAGRPELNTPIHSQSRLLMETKYGVPVETQLRYEHYFDNLTKIEPIPNWFDDCFPMANDFFNRFCVHTMTEPALMNYPSEEFNVGHKVTVPIIWPNMDSDTIHAITQVTQ